MNKVKGFDHCFVTSFDEVNDRLCIQHGITHIIKCGNIPLLGKCESKCEVLKLDTESPIFTLAGAEFIKQSIGIKNRTLLVYDTNQNDAVGVITAYMYIHLAIEDKFITEILSELIGDISCESDVVQSTMEKIDQVLSATGFTMDTWKVKVMTRDEFNALFKVDVGEFDMYGGEYPQQYDNVKPVSETVTLCLNNGVMPDKAKNICNRKRKDHTPDLIDMNEKECLLLHAGYYTVPSSFKKNTEVRDMVDKVSLTNEFMPAMKVDACVNTANEALQGGGGTDQMIHFYAGESLKKETSELPNVVENDAYYGYKCLTGDAKITSGHNLPAKYIVHVVTPYLNQDGTPNKKMHIKSYKSVLSYVDGENIRTMTLGPISTGYYGYPMLEATVLGLLTIRKWMVEFGDNLDKLHLWIYNKTQRAMYEKLLPILFTSSFS